MKYLLILCSILFFIALAPLPYGYFTLLRIVGTIGAGVVIFLEYGKNKEINFWIITFGIIAILFNPIIPIHLNSKAIWMPIDFVSGALFLVYAFSHTCKDK